MRLPALCIERPVATILACAALIVGGLFAWSHLPVAALPRTDFPVINVSASLPGASPDTMARAVATPLIKEFATIAGADTISSTSSQDSVSISIEFDLDRDIDAAAQDVQAAIARTQKQLPAEMTTPPSYRKVNPADAPILLLALRSDSQSMADLDAFAQQLLSPEISTVPGVSQVSVYGSQKYAVRIEIDPQALIARGIGIDEVEAAITAANANTPVGTLDSNAQRLTIQAQTTLANATDFSQIIVATRNGNPVRLADVATVIDSVENDKVASWYDGSRAIILAVQRQPDANTVEVVDQVKALLPALQASLPKATTISVMNDRSLSIRTAVDDVEFTLVLTIVLVILVIYLFLRRAVATIIPGLAVPISIIGTLGGMELLGFSIDNISLLALTLSVGLVVDDAIVMLENIVRHMEEEGLGPMEAAFKGSREIGFTIVSITVSLVAVFIPVLLMGGVVGRLFNEFAVVVTLAIGVSAFVSLTLTPVLASRLLRRETAGLGGGWLGRVLEGGFEAVRRAYAAGLAATLAAKPLVFAVFLATIAGTAWLGIHVPKGFFPQEDIGQLSVSTLTRQDISFPAMVALQNRVAEVVRASPDVAHVASIIGGSSSSGRALNQGRLFVELKPKEERGPLPQTLASLRRQLADIAGIQTYIVPVQNLSLGGRQSSSQYQFVMQGLNQKELYAWSQKLAEAMRRDPLFVDVASDLQDDALQATLVVDKDKASTLGISGDRLRSTLYSGFGPRQISTIYATGDSYEVLLQLDPSVDWTSDRLSDIHVRSDNGMLVPLGAFARIERTAGLLTINQLGQLPAVTLSFNLPAGVALSQAVQRIDELKASEGLPVTITTTFSGTAKTFQQSMQNQGVLLAAAVITIYIVLGMLYESFIHPLTILTGLPSAAVGALGALWLLNVNLDAIAIIGLLMLIGIVKKNAIMMIDVALTLQRGGMAAEEAIHRACLMRFRPIMMTTLAALVGALPIALGAGASAELRQPLGIVVVAGLVVSQLLTLFITPVIFLYMERLAGLFRRPALVSAA